MPTDWQKVVKDGSVQKLKISDLKVSKLFAWILFWVKSQPKMFRLVKSTILNRIISNPTSSHRSTDENLRYDPPQIYQYFSLICVVDFQVV